MSLSVGESLAWCLRDLGGVVDSSSVAETLAREAMISGVVSLSW